MLSQLLEYVIIFWSAALAIAVVFVLMKSFTDRIYHIRTMNKRAKRQRFVVFIDGIDAHRADIAMTKDSLQQCRYPHISIVMQTKRTDIQKTITKLHGDYALFLQAGTRVQPDVLFRLNRLFGFRGRVNAVILSEPDSTMPTLVNFYSVFSRSVRNICIDATEFTGFRFRRQLDGVAVRASATHDAQVVYRAVTLDQALSNRSTQTWDWIAGLYTLVAIIAVQEYVLYGQKTQLLIVLAQVGLTSVVLSLADSRSSDAARRLLALFASTSLFVIPASYLSSLLAVTHRWASQQINRRGAVQVRRT